MSLAGAGPAKAARRGPTITAPVEGSATPIRSGDEPALEVRSAAPSDAPGVCELVSRWANAGRLLPRSILEVQNLIECFVVARLGEEVVGCAALIVCGEAMAEIRSVAVDPRRTGHGIGRRMVEFLLDESMRLDLDRVFLLTRNPPFFERCGFRTIDPDDLPDSFVHDFVNIQQRTFADRSVMTREISDTSRVG